MPAAQEKIRTYNNGQSLKNVRIIQHGAFQQRKMDSSQHFQDVGRAFGTECSKSLSSGYNYTAASFVRSSR